MRRHQVALGAGILFTITVGAASAVQVQSAAEPGRSYLHVFGAPPAAVSRSSMKVDGALAEVAFYTTNTANVSVGGLHTLNPAARFRLAPPLATPEVAIDAITTGDPQALLSNLQQLGLRDSSVYANDVGGWLPVDQIANLSAVIGLHSARAAMPRTRAAVATQGDFAARSDLIRTAWPSLTGSGVTVGVLSDSFNCYAIYASPGSGVPASGTNGYAPNGFTATYSDDQTSGALPAGVNVVGEANCLSYGAPDQLPFTDEGRAILQIIHAVAPGAGLAFHTADPTEAAFATGIVALQQAGAKVIDDDVGYADEPVFQDGLVAEAVNQVASAGVVYFSSAGNEGTNSYENTAPVFSTVSGSEKLLNFDTSGKTNTTTLPLTIPKLFPGEFIFLVVEWDQPYVTGAPTSGGATSSIDFCVTGTAGGQDQTFNYPAGNPATCSGPLTLGKDPYQILIVGNLANASGNTAQENIGITIGLASGPAPGRIKFLLEADGAPATINAFRTNSPTLQGHPSSTSAAAVGAAFYYLTPQCGTSPAQLEPYSSVGGDPILFDDTGKPISSPQPRQKPDFVGPDGVNTTFLGGTLAFQGFSNDQVPTSITQCQNTVVSGTKYYPNFFGTSAAAPHAAATAALMLQANPGVTAAQIFAALRNSAAAMAQPIPNFSTGYGFMQADKALALLPPGAPTISVSPTTVVAGDTVMVTWSSVNTTSCTASGSWSGTQGTSGTASVAAPAMAGTAPYTLSCTNAVGNASATANLTVTAPPSKGGGGVLDIWTLLVISGLIVSQFPRPRARRPTGHSPLM